MMMATKMCDDTDSVLVSTFLSSDLDLDKEELRSSWWTRARRYRNSSGRLGMGHPREREPDCEWRLVSLGGHSDSRASGLAIGAWYLFVCTVTGQADLQEASGDHLLDAQQERPLLIWA